MTHQSLSYTRFFSSEKPLAYLLVFGIFYRLLIFLFLIPTGNDRHDQLIQAIISTKSIPISDGEMAFHPPLYHLLSVPWMLAGGDKAAQFFSVALSIANLALLYHLIKKTPLLSSRSVRFLTLALPVCLPEFVIFSSIISNDSLTYLLATTLFLLVFHYIENPSSRSLSLSAILLGLGLLTKGSFLAFVPPCILLIIAVMWKKDPTRNISSITKSLFLFSCIFGLLGCFKFVQNTIHFGRPIVHNQDFNPYWVEEQIGTIQGIRSFTDINIWKLRHHPHLSEENRHSVPLLYYASFWHPLYSGHQFNAVGYWTAHNLNQLIFLAAAPVTLLMLFGFFLILIRLLQFKSTFQNSVSNDCTHWLQSQFLLFCFCSLFALVTIAGIKYDTHSCFQSRLLFPCMLCFCLFLGLGLEKLKTFNNLAYRFAATVLLSHYGLLIARVIFEIKAKI